MAKKSNQSIRIEIDPVEFNRKRKKMDPEELAGYYNYTKKSAHVFKDRKKEQKLSKWDKKEWK